MLRCALASFVFVREFVRAFVFTSIYLMKSKKTDSIDSVVPTTLNGHRSVASEYSFWRSSKLDPGLRRDDD
jgi:hypothetical protein